MIPILFEQGERAFDTNGLGVLVAAVSCTIRRKINAAPELELQYPMDGKYFPQLRKRCILLARPGPGEAPQPFRIYRASKKAPGLITYYARHICYDLKGIPVAPFQAANAPEAMAALGKNAVGACPFIFSTDKTTVATMTAAAPAALWDLLGGSRGSVLDTYGGEYLFDRFQVRLCKRLGQDRGVQIRYGKNLTSLEQDDNCENTYTQAYPYWADADGNLVQLPERILPVPGKFDHQKTLVLDLSDKFEAAPTVEQLRAKAQAVIKERDIGVPAVSLTVAFVPLAQTAEYRDKAVLETVALGDDVAVFFPKMEITAQSRVVETEFDVLANRYKKITLGRVRSQISGTIAGNIQQTQQNSQDIFLESQKRESADGKVLAQVKIQEDRITSEVSDRKKADEQLNSRITQEAGKITAEVEKKVDSNGGSSQKCSWSMLPDNVIVRFNGREVLVVKESLFKFDGIIEARGGHIGGLEIGTRSLSFNGASWGSGGSNGMYLGPEGIQLGNAQLSTNGWVDITDGTFRGNTNAGGIRYGDSYGSFSGEGLSSHTVSGSRMKYNTISTSYTSSGINESLGYADYSNGVFNGWNSVNWIKAKEAEFGELTLRGHIVSRKTIQYKDGSGVTRKLTVLTA